MKYIDVSLLSVVLLFALDAVNRNMRNLSGLCYAVLSVGTFNLIVEIMQFNATVTRSTILFHAGCALASVIALCREHAPHVEPTGHHFRFLR